MIRPGLHDLLISSRHTPKFFCLYIEKNNYFAGPVIRTKTVAVAVRAELYKGFTSESCHMVLLLATYRHGEGVVSELWS